MPQTITITTQDDGTITVAVAEGDQPGEPHQVRDAAQALEVVQAALGEEGGEPAGEQANEPAEDYASAWQDEAAKRSAAQNPAQNQ